MNYTTISKSVRYIKFSISTSSYASNIAYIKTIKVETYEENAQLLKYESAGISSYENFKIINIKTPSTFKAGNYAYFKINELEEIMINGKMLPDKFYSLIYNSEKTPSVMELINNGNKEIFDYQNATTIMSSASLVINNLKLREKSLYRLLFNNVHTPGTAFGGTQAFKINIGGTTIFNNGSENQLAGIIDFFLADGYIYATVSAGNVSYVKKNCSNPTSIEMVSTSSSDAQTVANNKTFMKLYELGGDTI